MICPRKRKGMCISTCLIVTFTQMLMALPHGRQGTVGPSWDPLSLEHRLPRILVFVILILSVAPGSSPFRRIPQTEDSIAHRLKNNKAPPENSFLFPAGKGCPPQPLENALSQFQPLRPLSAQGARYQFSKAMIFSSVSGRKRSVSRCDCSRASASQAT